MVAELCHRVQQDVISFGFLKCREESQLRGNLCFRQDYFPTSFFDTIEDNIEIRAAVEIDPHTATCCRLVAFALLNRSTDPAFVTSLTRRNDANPRRIAAFFR